MNRLVGVLMVCSLPLLTRAAPLEIRGTLPWHNFLSGPTAWDEADYRVYLDRMKELGLNYLAFHCYTGGAERYAPYVEPMIRIEYRNVAPEAGLDTSLTARWGYRPMPLARFAFGTGKFFPQVTGGAGFGAKCAVLARNNEERYVMAQDLMRRVIDLAHQRGIQVGLGFEFGIHPMEFWSVAPPGWYIPGAMIPDPTHPAAQEILRATLDNILSSYPGLDWIWLWLHEHTMFVGQPRLSPAFQSIMQQDRPLFAALGDEAAIFTGVWSLAYIRAAYDYIKERSPRTRVAISGWGGGNQLTATLLGLHKALPREIVFSCLNPDQGLAPQAPFMAEIARERPVWAIPWLEGDSWLWHFQPRASLLLSQVKLARSQGLQGVLAIHWRTEENRANLESFAMTARGRDEGVSAEQFYRNFYERECGRAAGERCAKVVARLDTTRQWQLGSPEFFPYDPSWGRIASGARPTWSNDLAEVRAALEVAGTEPQKRAVEWLAANLEFAMLLDEVGRKIEPAYQLKNRSLLSRGKSDASEIARALESLRSAPTKQLFEVYASRVRSKGELGVLSSLNQKLWLQYLELDEFLTRNKPSP